MGNLRNVCADTMVICLSEVLIPHPLMIFCLMAFRSFNKLPVPALWATVSLVHVFTRSLPKFATICQNV